MILKPKFVILIHVLCGMTGPSGLFVSLFDLSKRTNAQKKIIDFYISGTESCGGGIQQRDRGCGLPSNDTAECTGLYGGLPFEINSCNTNECDSKMIIFYLLKQKKNQKK